MSVKNKTNKNYKRSQKGRSMVEMLGVLAIVGVLSVGGLYGYGVAMKKHKANELLHQASMQASSIAAQIASGKTDLALENFGNSSNGSFSSVKGPDGSTTYQKGDDKFTMQITGMDEAVCKQMQGMKGGTVRSVSCSTPDANGKVTATLAFNKDLSSTPVASDYNGDPDGCEASGRKYCDNDTCIPATEECPTGGSSGSSCKSVVVKVYNCETKTTTDCCPDTETCEQPVCTCNGDDDCPGQQECWEGTCSCPGGNVAPGSSGTGILGFDGATCCLEYQKYSGDHYYSGVDARICGCPEDTKATKNGVCCTSSGLAYAFSGHGVANIKECGCPEDGIESEETPGICCLDGLVWNGSSYRYPDPSVCPCPDGGSESETVSGVCCKNGGAWHNTRMKYAAMNIEACGGCPEDGIESEKTPGLCCKDGNAWSAVEGYDDVYSYNKWDPACNESNCPEDAMEGANFATTGVCCSTSGGFEYDNGVLNIQECGCPYLMGDPSETQPNVCCSDGGAWHPDWRGYYAVNVAACQGCPTSPISGNKGTISTDTSTCCYNGKAWSDEEPDYTKISSSCS